MSFRKWSQNQRRLSVVTIIDITFREFLILYQFFFPLKGKRSVIIDNKHGIYDLPHKLLNDLKLRILGNEENLETYRIIYNLVPGLASKLNFFFDTSRKLLKNWNESFGNALFHMKTRFCLIYFVHDCSSTLGCHHFGASYHTVSQTGNRNLEQHLRCLQWYFCSRFPSHCC